MYSPSLSSSTHRQSDLLLILNEEDRHVMPETMTDMKREGDVHFLHTAKNSKLVEIEPQLAFMRSIKKRHHYAKHHLQETGL